MTHDRSAPVVTDSQLHGLLRRYQDLLGIDWRTYRRRQSRRGVLSRLSDLGLDLDGYGERLESDEEERERLIEAMRVTVSRFYREEAVWRGLRDTVVPALLRALPSGQPFRVWSAGCASGEEPFSFALLWRDLPESLTAGHALEIVATDNDPVMLERARRAVYHRSTLREVPTSLRERWFEPCEDGSFQLHPEVATSVTFERRDLQSRASPPPSQLVFCRYLAFTYYRGKRLERVWRELRAALLPGAALVIGKRESLDPLAPSDRAEMRPWPEAPSVYARRGPRTTIRSSHSV